MARSIAIIALLGLAGCTSDASLFLHRTWPTDQVALIAVRDSTGRLAGEAPFVVGPGEPLRFTLDASGPIELRVRTYPTHDAGGPDFAACGARYGGDGGPVPAAASSWATGVVDPFAGGAIEPTLEAPAEDLGLRFVRCFAETYPCDQVAIDVFEVPALVDTGFQDVIALSDDRAVFATDEDGTIDVPLGQIDHGVVSRFGEGARPNDATRKLTWNGTGAILGVTFEGSLFELGTDGVITTRHTLTPTVAGVDLAEDGSLLAWGDMGVRALDRQAGAFVEPSSATFTELEVQKLQIVRRDRAVMLTRPDQIYVFDGTTWVHEYEPRASAFEKWDAVGGDEDVLVAVDRNGQILRRDEASHVWSYLPRPFAVGPEWKDVAGLGGGRFIVVGQSGELAIWTGDAWCTYLDRGTRLTLRTVSVAPSKKVVWAATMNVFPPEGLVPALVRIALPE